MLEGSAADVEPVFADKMYLSSGASVSGAQWKRLLKGGHIFLWMDYFSVPQIGNYNEPVLEVQVPRSAFVNNQEVYLFTADCSLAVNDGNQAIDKFKSFKPLL